MYIIYSDFILGNMGCVLGNSSLLYRGKKYFLPGWFSKDMKDKKWNVLLFF